MYRCGTFRTAGGKATLGHGAALPIIAVADPASAADLGSALRPDHADRYSTTAPATPGAGRHQHQNGGTHADDTAAKKRIRDRMHLRDGSRKACPNR